MTPTRPPVDDLDRFETALLGELRTAVEGRRPVRRRRRALTLGGVAVSAATALGLGLGLGGASPAFAVHRQSDGDIVVTIHRLEDSAGLERALAARGITADVDYTDPIPMKLADGRELQVIRVEPDRRASGRPLSPAECRFRAGGTISIERTGDGYVVTIPRESVLAHTPLDITATETTQPDGTPGGDLMVSYYGGRCVQVASNAG